MELGGSSFTVARKNMACHSGSCLVFIFPGCPKIGFSSSKYFACLQSYRILLKKKNREVGVESKDRKRLGSMIFLEENGVVNE